MGIYIMQKPRFKKTSIRCNEGFEGKSIEREIEIATQSKQPIAANSPLIYTKKSEGVHPEYDIRTDRWDIALDAMDNVNKSRIAKQEAVMAKEEKTDEDITLLEY